jgi:hypothetical protein
LPTTAEPRAICRDCKGHGRLRHKFRYHKAEDEVLLLRRLFFSRGVKSKHLRMSARALLQRIYLTKSQLFAIDCIRSDVRILSWPHVEGLSRHLLCYQKKAGTTVQALGIDIIIALLARIRTQGQTTNRKRSITNHRPLHNVRSRYDHFRLAFIIFRV